MFLEEKRVGEVQQPSLESFAAFVATKDPGEQYLWSNANVCACGQYATGIGRFDDWMNRNTDFTDPWHKLNELAKLACVRGSNYGTYGVLQKMLDDI